jgi:hypothetical protein
LGLAERFTSSPVELAAWPDKNHASQLVFITRGIAERHVRDLFASVHALAGDPS